MRKFQGRKEMCMFLQQQRQVIVTLVCQLVWRKKWTSRFKVVFICPVFYVEFGKRTLAPHCSEWVCHLMGSYPRKSLIQLWLNRSHTHSTTFVDTLSHTTSSTLHIWSRVLCVMSAKVKRFGDLKALALKHFKLMTIALSQASTVLI